MVVGFLTRKVSVLITKTQKLERKKVDCYSAWSDIFLIFAQLVSSHPLDYPLNAVSSKRTSLTT